MTQELDELAQLIKKTTAARGVDLYAVDVCGVAVTEWAEMTGRNRVTVQRNLQRGREESD